MGLAMLLRIPGFTGNNNYMAIQAKTLILPEYPANGSYSAPKADMRRVSWNLWVKRRGFLDGLVGKQSFSVWPDVNYRDLCPIFNPYFSQRLGAEGTANTSQTALGRGCGVAPRGNEVLWRLLQWEIPLGLPTETTH